MKNILIATDFSKAARNAATYGVRLAATFNATPILFHAYQPISAPVDVSQYAVSADVRQAALHHLADEISLLNTHHHSKLYTLAEEGPVAATILRKAARQQIDLIVLGMKAKFKGWRWLFGSTVTTLASRSDLPILIVPERATFHGVNVLAVVIESDLSINEKQWLLNVLTALAGQYRAAVYLVRISQNQIQEAYQLLSQPYRLSKVMASSGDFLRTSHNEDVSAGLSNFIENFQVDILAILMSKPAGHAPLSHHGLTRQMIYQAQIPLLLMHNTPG